MSTITPPRAGVPIGRAVVAGRNVVVDVDEEYLRFFASLTERAGGVSGSGTTDLSVAQFEDAGIEETKALLHVLANEAGQAPSGIEEQLRALTLRVIALEQGAGS